MFSRYKKSGDAKDTAAKPALATTKPAPQPATRPVDAAAGALPASMRRAQAIAPAQTVAMDRDRKRRERLGEIKLELHRALLDNLNLSALESATENDLRSEITSIAS